MNVICKVFGHKIIDWYFKVKMCSRCGFVTNWGDFSVDYSRYTIPGIAKFRVAKYGDVREEDL